MVARNQSLTRLRRRAGYILTCEALVTAAGPSVLILLAYFAAALFGIGNRWALIATLALALAALFQGLRKFTRPTPAAIDRRIETVSRLAHRPLAVLDDAPATPDPQAAKIWALHKARAQAALDTARTGAPAFQTAAHDPFALRGFLLLLLIAGLVIAGPAAPTRLAGALALPAWPFAAPVATVWITPPAYATSPPEILDPGQKITVLTGSTLTILVNGARRPPAIRFNRASLPIASMGDAAYRTDTILTASGTLRIGPWWHSIASWRLTILPPAAPVITLQDTAITGPASLRIGWSVHDDYGLASLTARLAPAGYKDALKLTFPLNPAGRARRLDLPDSPYAGIGLTVTLTGTNFANVSATATAARQIVLPGDLLHDKTAITLAGLRQRIALTPSAASWAGADLGLIAAAPPSPITGGADVQIAALGAALVQHELGAQAAVDRLSALIHEIEAGPDFLPARQLAQANAALLQALKAGLNGRQVNPAALQSLLNAMRQALAQHLAALRQALGSEANGAPTTGPVLDPSALDRLAEQIAKDEAAGRTAQAAAELRQLQAALNALQSAQPMTAAQAAAAAAAQQAASALSQLTNGEAALLNQTHQGEASAGEQTMLQSGLQATQQGLAKAGIALPGLNGAGGAMQAAQGALGAADLPGAESAEAAAIRYLQQAQAALAAKSQNSLVIGQGSESAGQEGDNGMPDLQPDPGLGLPAPNPAAAIQQQIMNEDSNPSLPSAVHQYLRRLLTPDQ